MQAVGGVNSEGLLLSLSHLCIPAEIGGPESLPRLGCDWLEGMPQLDSLRLVVVTK